MNVQSCRKEQYLISGKSVVKLLRQRVFILMLEYEDCNDVELLKNDLLFKDIPGGCWPVSRLSLDLNLVAFLTHTEGSNIR